MERGGRILVNLTRGTVICEQLVVADRAVRRMRGLLGRKSLTQGEGILLQPAPSIHTAFMRFDIDVVFMDGTLRVTKIVEHLGPWRMASSHQGWAALELAAGEAQRLRISTGDQLGVVEVTDRVGAVITALGRTQRPRRLRNDDSTMDETDTALAVPTLVADGVAANATARGTKVLIAGTDRRFRSVAVALLARRGCTVTLADRMADVAGAVQREQPDVVVLDSGHSPALAVRWINEIEAIDPPIGLVLVGDEPDHRPSMLVLPKWGSFDQLYGAIQDAKPGRKADAA